MAKQVKTLNGKLETMADMLAFNSANRDAQVDAMNEGRDFSRTLFPYRKYETADGYKFKPHNV